MATPMMIVSAWAPPETGVPGTEFHASAGEINTSISHQMDPRDVKSDEASWQTDPVTAGIDAADDASIEGGKPESPVRFGGRTALVEFEIAARDIDKFYDTVMRKAGR